MPSPTYPAPRIAYDQDGSFAFISRTVGTDRSPFAVQPNALQRLNADHFGGLAIPSTWWAITNPMPNAEHYLAVVFPMPHHIVAWFASSRSRFSNTVGAVTYITDIGLDIELQVSRDTTNGLDGTWKTMIYKSGDDYHLPFSTEHVPLLPDDTAVSGAFANMRESGTFGDPAYKDASQEDSGWQYVLGPAGNRVKGLRLVFPRKPQSAQSNYNWTLLHLHLYGYPDETATENRLVMLDGTTEDPLENLSWGDVDLAAEVTTTIKVQNISTTLTAAGIIGSLQSGYPIGAPPSVDSLALSLDGITWDDSVTIGDLAPGEISDEIHVRLLPATGTIGLRFARIKTEVEEWT